MMTGSDTSSTELALIKAWAKTHGLKLVANSSTKVEAPVIEASAPIIAPVAQVGIIEKLVKEGMLQSVEGFRTLDKEGFSKLRTYAKAHGLLLNTQSVILSITPA